MTMEDLQRKNVDNIGGYLRSQACGGATVNELIERKGRSVFTVAPEATVLEALRSMSRHGVGALVAAEGGRVVGVISERDYARKVILTGKSSSETSVAEIMGTPVNTVSPEQTVSECMEIMTAHHIRHLPVLKDGRLVGLVSIGDLVKSIISDQERRLEKFEQYVSGSYPT